VAALASVIVRPALAGDTWPTRTITLYVGYPVGTAADIEARELAHGLSTRLGQPVVVVDVPGANTVISLKDVQELPPDGYSLLFITKNSTFVWADPKMPYPMSQFVPVAQLTADATAFYVRDDSPLKTLPDLVDYARKNPNKLTMVTFGTLSSLAQDVSKLEHAANIKIKCIPYDGGPAQIAAVLGGHADAGLGTTSTLYANVKAGNFRILAELSPMHPYPFLPDAPTIGQYGYKFTNLFWRGLIVKQGTPDAIVQRLVREIKGVVTSAQWKTYEERQVQVDTFQGSADFAKTLAADINEARHADPQVCGQ
jgi:tripartite-type tricarboxylate transporter receptor subunit TctC